MLRLAKLFLMILGCSALIACAARPYLDRGDQLLDDGQTQAAIDAYESGLSVDPGNAPLLAHLRRARHTLLETTWQQAVGELAAAHYDAALRIAMRARKLAQQNDDAALAARAADLLQRVTQGAETYVGVLQARGRQAPAAALSEQILSVRHDPQHEVWVARVHGQVVDAFRSAGQRALAAHPGSAAVQYAMARRYEDPDGGNAGERFTLKAAWWRFTEYACFAEPTLDVRAEPGAHGGPLARMLQDATQRELSSWRNRCGRGTQPLHVHVSIDGVEVVDQSSTEPAALARRGVQLRTEEPFTVNETLSDTEETTTYEGRVEAVHHRDCPPGETTKCRVWTEDVHRQIPVKRLHVVEHSRPVEHWHVLPNLPESKIIHFERTIITRRVVCHGHISVDGAGFASVPFVVTAESTDSGHPEVSDGITLLPADSLDAHGIDALYSEAAQGAANDIRTAVQEAARDWAEQLAERALDLQKSQPEAAEELYLRMLGLGLDNGQDVRTFFMDRYGVAADEVLGNLATALGHDHPPADGAAAADLTLLYKASALPKP